MAGLLLAMLLVVLLTLLATPQVLTQTAAHSKHANACYLDDPFRTDTLWCPSNEIIQITDIEVGFVYSCLGLTSPPPCAFHLISSDKLYYQFVESLCHGRNSCTINSNDVRNQTFKNEFHRCGNGNIQDRNSVRVEYYCKSSPHETTIASLVTSANGDSSFATGAIKSVSISLTHPTLANRSAATSYTFTQEESSTRMLQSYGTEKSSSKFPLSIVLGIIGGLVIALALVCLVLFLFIRNKRRKSGKDTAGASSEFTYYSPPNGAQGTTLQTHLYDKNCPVASIDSNTYKEDNTEHYYSSPEALKQSEDESVYAEVEDPTERPPTQTEHHIYNECEIVPPCPYCTGDRLYDQPISMIDNDFYNTPIDGVKTDTSKLI